MKGRRHTPEQVVRKLREADKLLGEGFELPDVLKEPEVSEATYHRWRAQFGGMKRRHRHRTDEHHRPARQHLHLRPQRQPDHQHRNRPQQLGLPRRLPNHRRPLPRRRPILQPVDHDLHPARPHRQPGKPSPSRPISLRRRRSDQPDRPSGEELFGLRHLAHWRRRCGGRRSCHRPHGLDGSRLIYWWCGRGLGDRKFLLR
jgi:putative transposase